MWCVWCVCVWCVCVCACVCGVCVCACVCVCVCVHTSCIGCMVNTEIVLHCCIFNAPTKWFSKSGESGPEYSFPLAPCGIVDGHGHTYPLWDVVDGYSKGQDSSEGERRQTAHKGGYPFGEVVDGNGQSSQNTHAGQVLLVMDNCIGHLSELCWSSCMEVFFLC